MLNKYVHCLHINNVIHKNPAVTQIKVAQYRSPWKKASVSTAQDTCAVELLLCGSRANSLVLDKAYCQGSDH